MSVALGAPLVTSLVASHQATTVPPEVQLPGTQPLEVGPLTAPDACASCHGGYDTVVEPTHNWEGSMMAHASIDPLFWATMAVTEQTYDGAGDFCIRCHLMDGWLEGRSTPTDGSAFLDSDARGVSCNLCHRLTNPDGSEYPGVQSPPFIANDGASPAEGWYGISMAVLHGSDIQLGPFHNANTGAHATAPSSFHRSGDLCGTCHDVSNPLTGDLAHNFGAMTPLAPGSYDGTPGGNVDDKAAFNNPPYAYGAVERTYSEWRISALSNLRVQDYATLPDELEGGALEDARDAAVAVRPDGNYADGTVRTFTCQTCHMKPKPGRAARQMSAQMRPDIAVHELTGGSSWMPDVLAWMSGQGTLHLGGALTGMELSGLAAGKQRALDNLERAASLVVDGQEVHIVNLTGHKLPTGYPEGRRMWLHVRWLDDHGALVREDGAYGPTQVQIGGQAATVETLLSPSDPNLRAYVIEPGITQEWAQQLIGLGTSSSLAIEYDSASGAVSKTLGQLAGQPAGTIWKSFHFALNNAVTRDTRIPPYGMPYDESLERSILPVPASQYGNPGPGGTYDHADRFTLAPPTGAARAELRLLYQSTSWEYIQFLERANDGSIVSLASTGTDLRQAWQATGMSAPVEMATGTWYDPNNIGTRICDPAVPNSSGRSARIRASGSPYVVDQGLRLTASSLPPWVFGIFVVGEDSAFVPMPGGSDGNLCVGGTIGRFLQILNAGPMGEFSLDVNLSHLPLWPPVPVTSGESWTFQAWFRDSNPLPTSNYSDALEILFL